MKREKTVLDFPPIFKSTSNYKIINTQHKNNRLDPIVRILQCCCL